MPTRAKSLAQRQHQIKRNRRKAESVTRRMTVQSADLDKLRSSGQWQKARAIVRQRQPLCADPFGTHRRSGIVTPTQQAHHIIGAAENVSQFFDGDNLVGLCAGCHMMIEARERKGVETQYLFEKIAGGFGERDL